MAVKPHINLVFIGHVDHGKSTTVGRLLYDTGAIDEQTMRKLKEKAVELGKVGFEFAFVMDQLAEERERGVTISLSYKKFETDKNVFTIIDAPGHKDFIKNMITGTSQADAAVLVVTASEGIQEQTKEHVFLAKTLGVKQMIIAINKMDAVGYDEKKFKEIKDQVGKLLTSVGYKLDEVPFVPIASLHGQNIAKPSTEMPWYKGLTLVKTLDTIKATEKPTKLPLRMPVQDVYTIKGIGTVPVGRIETGIMKAGDQLLVMPSGAKGELKSIEMHHEQLQSAEPGDNVGLNVRGLEKNAIKRGDMICHVNSPATVVQQFTGQIIVLNHPTVITVGYTPVFHVNTAQVSCKLVKIERKIDPRTGATLAENPDFIKNGDAAIITVEPTKPLCIEKYKEFPQLAKFAIRDMGRTVAAGMCIDVVPKK